MLDSRRMRDRENTVVLWLAGIGFFMETLDSTIVNTVLPTMAASFSESPLSMHWVVVAYSLVIAVLTPASGWLSDYWGTRKTFFMAILLFCLGSSLCAQATSLNSLIVARVIQGMGGSFLLPVGRLVVLKLFPGEKYLEAIGFISILGMMGPLLGPTLGGFLVKIASWHWIFLVNIPIGLAGALITFFKMPQLRAIERHPFDLRGYLMLAGGMLAISFALDGATTVQVRWVGPQVMIVFGLAAFTAYWLYAAKEPRALFPTSLFNEPKYRVGILGNMFARIGGGSMPFLLPMSLQLVLNYSPLESGWLMIAVAAAGMASKQVVRPAVKRFGFRVVLLSNTLMLGVSILTFILMKPNQSFVFHGLLLFIFGWFNSFQFTAMNSLTLADLPERLSSSGNSLFSMVQLLSMSLGVTAGSAILNAFSRLFGAKEDLFLRPFHATFATVGLMTMGAGLIFWQLPRQSKRSKSSVVSLVH